MCLFHGLIISWVIGTFSLRFHVDHSRRLHFGCVDDVCDLFLDVVARQSLVILIDDFFVDLRGRVTITFVSSLSFGLVLSCRVHWCTVGDLPGPTSVPQSPG